MTRSTNMKNAEVLERLRGVLEHGKMGDKCLIAPDLVTAAIAALSAPQPSADGGFTAADMADASAQGFRDGVASVGVVGDECAPAEAQPCGCGEATCTVPWEPGCGLGKSEQHAEAQPASDGGFTAADMMDARQEGRKEAQQLVGVEAVLRDALQGLIDFIEIDNLPMDADAMFIAKRALAAQQGGRSDDMD